MSIMFLTAFLATAMTSDPAVSNVNQLLTLPDSAYSNHLSFAFSGDVLLNDETGFALHDQTGTIWIRSPRTDVPSLKPGMIVSTYGHLFINDKGDNDKQAVSVSVKGHHALPRPVSIDFNDIRSGRYDYRSAQASGVITSVVKDEMDNNYNWLTLRTNDGAIQVAVAESELSLSQAIDLIGSKVSVVGTVLRSSAWANSFIHYLSISGNEASITVLSSPPWLSQDKLRYIISALCLLLVIFLIWNSSLKILSTRRARQLFSEQIKRAESELKNEERTRLAIELHDSVSQNLSAVTMELETAKRLAADTNPRLEQILSLAWHTLHATRDELRNCLFDLRGQTLEEKDLASAIRNTLRPHLRTEQLFIRFQASRELFSDTSTHAILSIIRELVLNGLKHGHARTFRIAGSIENGSLHFSVRDDGTGFDPQSAPGAAEGHFGLLGIRSRVERLNGVFTLASAPGSGTRANISIPIPKREKSKK